MAVELARLLPTAAVRDRVVDDCDRRARSQRADLMHVDGDVVVRNASQIPLPYQRVGLPDQGTIDAPGKPSANQSGCVAP